MRKWIPAFTAFFIAAHSVWPVAAGATVSGKPVLRQKVSAARTAVDLVNPFVGTGAHGHTYPGPGLPFGMVQLSPDTGTTGWDHCSGYHYSDDSIMGFSHTHLSGCGAADLGDVLLSPTTNENVDLAGTQQSPEGGYTAKFSHADETASPGYYSVKLQPSGINVELTATTHVGLHRYKFPPHETANIVVDLQHGIGDKVLDSSLRLLDAHTLVGSRHSSGFAPDQSVFFVAQFSQPIKETRFWISDADKKPGADSAAGTGVKALLAFGNVHQQSVVAKVAISSVSIENALVNLNAEASGWNFDEVKSSARARWNIELSKIDIPSGSEEDRKIFYTALYHCMVSPQQISDVDGSYRGSDQHAHRANGFVNYSNFSLWDTFRAEHPLLTIVEPDRVNDIVNAFIVQADNHPQKSLPVIPLWSNETYCMIGYHSFPVIAEAYAKGFRNWDAHKALDLMVLNSRQNDWWEKIGYMPCDKEKEATSKTLEFAYDDWCAAQLAKQLGRTTDYEYFMKRAGVYKNVFDTKVGFMRPRVSDGQWKKPFDAADFKNRWPRDFTEANAYQYTFFVPHDVQGLVQLMGGRDQLAKKLDGLFETKYERKPDDIDDVTGMVGLYSHGNEPDHHVAYLYNFAGQPWRTADKVKEIRTTQYANTPEGICGNEDCGQMSAWYVFSALGFYPVNPVDGQYLFGTPAFSEATIKLPAGKQFKVVAHDLSQANKYIVGATLNGKPLDRLYIKHAEIADGGTLEFTMAAQPNKLWGTHQ